MLNCKTTWLPQEKKKKKEEEEERYTTEAYVNLSHMKTKYNLHGPDICAKISAASPNLFQVKRELLQRKKEKRKKEKEKRKSKLKQLHKKHNKKKNPLGYLL